MRKRPLLVITIVLLVSTLILMVTGGCGRTKTVKPVTQDKDAAGQAEVSIDDKKPQSSLILATTTSTKDSGLLDELIPEFESKFNIKVKIIAVGTGEALKMGEEGEADVLLVHARTSEDEFMAAGFGSVRKDVMYNDFVVLGPESDPAKIKGVTDAAEALKKIAGQKALFVTRGDDSGTHKKELKLWESAGIKPTDDWYLSTGQGMGDSLSIANEKLAYILSDRATFLAQKAKIDLVIAIEGDKALLNPYGIIAVNPEKWPKVNRQGAMDFIDWLVSLETQEKISRFGQDKFGEPLFVPDSEEWHKSQK